MSHAHTHEHSHVHSHDRAFAIGVSLNILFVVVEIGYGLAANSMALIADAGHNVSDVLGLLLAWGAAILSRRAPTTRRTYGYRRSSILAALMNATLLLVAIGGIAWEAIGRFRDPQAVEGGVMIWVAAVGVVINGLTAMLFMRGHGDLNIRGAFLHMAADAGVSLGVVVAGVLIGATGLLWIDPVMSLVIVAVIAYGTWGLLRESMNLALDAVPENIDPEGVEEFLTSRPGVRGVHDLHIWGMSTTEPALTAHLELAIEPNASVGAVDTLVAGITEELAHRFGIGHATLQVESGSGRDCCCRK